MNTRDVATEFRLEHWAQVMHERVDKGLSIRAYCESAGIHQNTYFYWQRKLRETTCSGIQRSAIESDKQSLVPNGWTTLCVNEKMEQPHSLTIEVGGCRIAVCADTDPELLTKVCRALRTL